MSKDIRERYKVNKTPIQQSYEYQLALKHNEEYERRVDQTFVDIGNLFIEMYPNIRMEAPRQREKTPKSLIGKIKKLEIERLCKLYAIEGIDNEQKETLISLLRERIEKELIESNEVENIVDEIFYKEIEDLDNINKMISEEKLSDNTKTAILRIVKSRIEKEDVKNKKQLNKEIEERYGITAAKNSNSIEKNLLHWECIDETKKDKAKLEILHNPHQYLRAKDLRGMKFIISYVPDDINTKSKKLKQVIDKRKEASKEEKNKYNDMSCILLAQEFVDNLISNKELLKKLNIQVIKDGYKHKAKSNGYIAEHIRFSYIDHPEYIFEIQFRSMYREELSRAHGPAAHDKRLGKKRIFPNTENKENFMEEFERMVPKYKILKRDQDKFSLQKCTPLANMLQYYLGYVEIDSEEYKKAMEYLKQDDSIIK